MTPHDPPLIEDEPEGPDPTATKEVQEYQERKRRRQRKQRQKQLTVYLKIIKALGYKLLPEENAAPKKRGRPAKDTYRVPSLEAAAIGTMAVHPGWSLRKIAAFIGCSEEALSRSEKVQQADEIRGLNRYGMDAGYQLSDGQPESYDPKWRRRIENATIRRRNDKGTPEEEESLN
jgi:hypothetical protein